MSGQEHTQIEMINNHILFKTIYSLTKLCQLSVVAPGIFHCSSQDAVAVVFGLGCSTANGVLVPQPRIKSTSPALQGGQPGKSQ